jgi:hypothetical protein
LSRKIFLTVKSLEPLKPWKRWLRYPAGGSVSTGSDKRLDLLPASPQLNHAVAAGLTTIALSHFPAE